MEFSETGDTLGPDMLQELISPVSSTRLEIVVPDYAEGQYELPVPASKCIPEWYKGTDLHHDEHRPLDKSVRACMPFMEALTFGWIVPVPTDVAITQSPDGMHVDWNAGTYKAMGNHSKDQVGGESFPSEGEILKFNLPYALRTPDGVSTLYMPPLNRIEPRLMPFSGVIDTDRYVNEANIPALMLEEDFEGVIEAGTPLVQIIPFERKSLVNESNMRGATDKEEEWLRKTGESVPAVDGYYKEHVWEPKKASRETGGCPLGFGDSE